MPSKAYETVLSRKIDSFIGSFAQDSDSIFKRDDNTLIHPGEYGKYRENAFKELIQMVLSKDKAVSEGFIITSDDDMSAQCDVIIYSADVPPFIAEGAAKLFPIEDIHAVIEIKSEMSYKDVKESLRKLAKIKALTKKRRGVCRKDLIMSGETEDIATYLVCKKFKFQKGIDHQDVYEGIPGRFWHNGILSLEDGYYGYQFENARITEGMKETLKRAGGFCESGKESWEYPVHLEGDEQYSCRPNFLIASRENSYKHIKEFFVCLQKVLYFMKLYSSDAITYLGFGTEFMRGETPEVQDIELLIKAEKEFESAKLLDAFFGKGHLNMIRPKSLSKKIPEKQAFVYMVSQYMDYMDYWKRLESIGEDFDESLEYYDPSAWFEGKVSRQEGSELSIDIMEQLSMVCEMFCELVGIMESRLSNLLEKILKSKKEIKVDLLGKAYCYDENQLKEMIESLVEIERQDTIEENFEEFLRFLDKNLEEESF